MDLAEFTDPSLVREITSRTSTRSTELLHNRTQLFINPIISMDTKDHEDLLQSLPMFKTIKPAAKPNQLPNPSYKIHAISDGRIQRHNSIIYITNQYMTTEVTSRVCGDKRRTNKRTTPASEALSGILWTDQVMQEAVKTSHRTR